MVTQDDIIKAYKESNGQGKEPIRLLKNITDIDAWSYLPTYQIMSMVIAETLNDDLPPEVDTLRKFLDHYYRICLSREGIARI
jgi:hypothetical protein